MIQFKKSNYKPYDLHNLSLAIEQAISTFKCNHNCDNCPCRLPCTDLHSLHAYLEMLYLNSAPRK